MTSIYSLHSNQYLFALWLFLASFKMVLFPKWQSRPQIPFHWAMHSPHPAAPLIQNILLFPLHLILTSSRIPRARYSQGEEHRCWKQDLWAPHLSLQLPWQVTWSLCFSFYKMKGSWILWPSSILFPGKVSYRLPAPMGPSLCNYNPALSVFNPLFLFPFPIDLQSLPSSHGIGHCGGSFSSSFEGFLPPSLKHLLRSISILL